MGWEEISGALKTKLIAAYGDEAEHIYAVVAESMDVPYYVARCLDMDGLGFDPVVHYLLKGGNEGKNPSEMFDARYYLYQNPDVKAARINPFYHYLVAGQSEGRQPLPGPGEWPPPKPPAPAVKLPILPVPEQEPWRLPFEDWKAVVAEKFSPEYYLCRYPDVEASGIDPYEHYFYTGWNEGRQPCWDFDPQSYLGRYPDVQQSKIEPLYHYLGSGRSEGRQVQDELEDEIHHLNEAPTFRLIQVDIAKTSYDAAITFDDIDSLRGRLQRLYEQERVSGLVVAVSHSDVMVAVGGIENCVRDEQQALSASGWIYVQLYPVIPSLVILPDELANYPLGVNVNGQAFGVIRGRDILALLTRSAELRGRTSAMVVHSLLGHALGPLLQLAKQLQSSNYLWVHDFSFLCSNHLLTRNELEYCGAPFPGSTVCSICSFGETRPGRLAQAHRLLDELQPTVLAPSPFALDLFCQRTGSRAFKLNQRILPHTQPSEFVRTLSIESSVGSSSKRPLRIGYLGYENFHKGWAAWKYLLRRVDRMQGVEFVHLGKRHTVIDFVEHHDVEVTADHRNAMVDAVEAANLDFAFIWPNWPETYSYVACEALAGGALILTNPNSGNVRLLAERNQQGLVFEDLDALVREINGDQSVLRQRLQSREGKTVYSLLYNAGCASELERSERGWLRRIGL